MNYLEEKIAVLIVEDEEVSAMYLSQILRTFGCDVVAHISDGALVLPFIEHSHADIILMDISLQGQCDGIAAAAGIATRFDIPVVFTTSSADHETIQRAMATAPFGYILKPYNQGEIYSTIQLALMRHRKEKAEKELRQYHAFYEYILENIDDGIWVTDSQGIVRYTNEAMKKMDLISIGISAESQIHAMLAEEEFQRIRGLFRKVCEERLCIPFTNSFLNMAGNPRYISGLLIPYIVDGVHHGMICCMTDTTEKVYLQRQVIEADDARKAKIGRDLHDSLGQILTGVSLLAKSARMQYAQGSDDVAESLSTIEKITGEAISVTRYLSQGLVPVEFHADGLFGALDHLSSRVDSAYKIPCLVLGDRSVVIDDHTLASHILLVAQEGVNNAIRHGRAEVIEIYLSLIQNQIVFSVSNNGKPYQTNDDETGIGLKTMNYRAGLYGGTIGVSADERGWTVLTCTFNMHNELRGEDGLHD